MTDAEARQVHLDHLTAAEKALSELAYASSNYLEYLANPHSFVGEPRHLILDATQRAFELLKKSDQHWFAENAKAQDASLRRTYGRINTLAMMR